MPTAMPRFLTLLMLAALLAGCATLGEKLPPPPTPEEIVQLSKDKFPAEDIIKRMEASRAVYRLPASELAKLREQGVPDQVIDYMQKTYIEAERYDEWRARYYGWPHYRGYVYGPYYGPYGWRGRRLFYWW